MNKDKNKKPELRQFRLKVDGDKNIVGDVSFEKYFYNIEKPDTTLYMRIEPESQNVESITKGIETLNTLLDDKNMTFSFDSGKTKYKLTDYHISQSTACGIIYHKSDTSDTLLEVS